MSSSDGDGISIREDYWEPLMEGDYRNFVTGSGRDPVWNFFAGAGESAEADSAAFDALAYGGREALAPDRSPAAEAPGEDSPPIVDAWAYSLPDRVAAESEGPEPAEGDLLIHPEHEDTALAWMIDNADSFLQQSLRLFGSGNGEAVPDFSAWLHNHGLVDSVNSSAMTDSYSVHITGIEVDKDLFQGLEDTMTVTVEQVRQRSDEAVSYIDGEIAGLNEFLGYADDVLERVEVRPMDSPDGAPVGETVTTRYRVHPQYREFLEGEILDTIAKVEDKIRQVAADNEGSGVDGPEYDPGDPVNPSHPVRPAAPGPFPAPAAPAATPVGAAGPATTENSGAGLGTEAGDLIDDALGGDSVTPDAADTPGSEGDPSASDNGAAGTGTPDGATDSGGSAGPASTGGDGAGGMTGLSAMMPMMMLPQMMAATMAEGRGGERNRADRGDENRRRDDERARPAAPPAPQTAAPAVTAPPPTEAGSALTLPDGSSPKVPPAVAQAVNRELNNTGGSDARAAYEGTSGAQTPASPWTMVDPGSVRTGDVAQWANRTGLVVVTESGLQLIVGGEMVPLNPHDPPGGGIASYGEFQGFLHPTGVDRAEEAASIPA